MAAPSAGPTRIPIPEMSEFDRDLFDRDFREGKYLLMCFSPDVTDGKPHFRHGMQKEIIVR